VKCHISTVMRATAYFEELGWLYKKKRGYCSNLYYLNDEIIALDLNDEKVFLRPQCEENATVLRSSFLCNDINSTEQPEVHAKKAEENRPIPACIKISSITPADQQRLANHFSEWELVNSVIAAKKYTKWGNKIKSMISVIWKGAKNGWS